MDTSLINLIPNLTTAVRRCTTLPRSECADPSPSYTIAEHPSPQREDNARSDGIPLHIEILGSTNPDTNNKTWSGDDNIALGPTTTYAEFLSILQRKLSDVKVSGDSREWKASIAAEYRGRTRRRLWQSQEQACYVTRENWWSVLEWLLEGSFRGLNMVCWID